MLYFLNIKARTKKIEKLLKSSKPYWNDELTTLWKILKQDENEFLKCKSSKEIKRNKKNIFIECRKLFDKKFRFYERHYNRDRSVEIESLEENNPQIFWQSLKTKNRNLPTVIKDYDGSVITDHTEIMNRWRLDFSSLYNGSILIAMKMILIT